MSISSGGRTRLAFGLALLVMIALSLQATLGPTPSSAETADRVQLTDEPGNWFRSERTGTPVTVIERGDDVQFEIGKFTQTKHTVTLISKPTTSTLTVDQDHAQRGSIGARFDQPGVYLFTCKVHPFMQGVVGVKDAQGNIPPVTAAQLPFIRHLGAESLPADVVLSVLPAIAASDEDKRAKWDIFSSADETRPAVPGVGEVWVNTQFERVPNQTDGSGVLKPGTITVVDAGTFRTEREINGRDPDAQGGWNNPHNLWSNTRLSVMYNANWFGRTLNKINRATGDILTTTQVGEAPTHVVTNPNQASSEFGFLTNPLSADNDLVKLRDSSPTRLDIVDKDPTGNGHTHPHGHWLTSNGARVVVPNVFKGVGFGGSVSVMDAVSNRVLAEINHAATGLRSALLLPVASGIKGNQKAYISNIGSGQISVVDLSTSQIIKNVPVTFTPDGRRGSQFTIFDTLQAPIQIPVSPDGRFAAAAVLSLTAVPRSPTNSPDHVAIIDTVTDSVVAFLPTPAGTHGAHWGAKRGGGYYLYVTNQFSNALTVIDPDPNRDNSGADAAVVGRLVLSNGSAGAGVTDGTGGQGLKPLPNMYNGWIQDTVALSGTGQLSAEVQGWISALTAAQKNP
jgi:YVTN family beta-propeller protein